MGCRMAKLGLQRVCGATSKGECAACGCHYAPARLAHDIAMGFLKPACWLPGLFKQDLFHRCTVGIETSKHLYLLGIALEFVQAGKF